MNNGEPIDVESRSDAGQAVALRQPGTEAVARHQGSPLDMPPALFKEGLERRGSNRKSLMAWIRDSLVEGTDFAKIHVVSKSRCPNGNKCTNASHFSKPGLLKPGAEKICGMLGLQTTFPRLCDYEEACLKGTAIKQIILRCELVNEGGKIVGEGVGARNLEQDWNDINKSLKMAEKSAHIDATLRTAGLSEVFSQDEDDGFMTPEFQQPQAEAEAPRNSNTRGLTGGRDKNTRVASEPPISKAANTARTEADAKARTVSPAGGCATAKHRDRMIEVLIAWEDQRAILEYARKASVLLPTETLPDWPLQYVPVDAAQIKLLQAAIKDFMDGGDAVKPFVNPLPEPEKSATPKKNYNVGGPAPGLQPEPAAEAEPWRSYVLPFGKDRSPLGQMSKKTLFGWWANFRCEPTYEKDGKVHTKSPASLAKDKEIRKMLDEAGRHYEFTMKEAA